MADNTEALPPLPDYVPMDHEAMTSIHLPGDVVSDTKARQEYARNVERKAVAYYAAQIRAAREQIAAEGDEVIGRLCEAFERLLNRVEAEGSAYCAEEAEEARAALAEARKA